MEEEDVEGSVLAHGEAGISRLGEAPRSTSSR